MGGLWVQSNINQADKTDFWKIVVFLQQWPMKHSLHPCPAMKVA
jgi:hypothetical protein